MMTLKLATRFLIKSKRRQLEMFLKSRKLEEYNLMLMMRKKFNKSRNKRQEEMR